MTDLIRPNDLDVVGLLNYAGGHVSHIINEPKDVEQRHKSAVLNANILNLALDGREPWVRFYNARFRGSLPTYTDGPVIIQGTIEGAALEFSPWLYRDDVGDAMVGRYVMMLTVYDAGGIINVADQSYRANGPIEYHIDLAHTLGPIEVIE